jgi:hypothetical protein
MQILNNSFLQRQLTCLRLKLKKSLKKVEIIVIPMANSEPKVIPGRADGSINLRIITIIIVSVTAFHYSSIYFLEENASELAATIFSILNPIGTTIAAFVVAKRYLPTKIFFKSYLFLAIAYLCAAGGEILYGLYDYVLDEPAYPSPADILFVPFYPLVLGHLFLNVSFFKPTIKARTLSWMILLPISLVLFYLNLAGDLRLEGIDLLSLYYITVSSISLTLTIYGASIFKEGIIGKSWLLLLFGIIGFAIADVVYYNLEAEQSYSLAHPVNLLWYGGYWITTYALYKHRKVL